MRILAVNKFFYKRGGSESYYFNLNNLLERNNHEIIPFSMKDDRNYDSEFSRFFIENIDYNSPKLINKIKNATKIVYSLEAKRKIDMLIRENNLDIAHLHIFQHQMSPSIIHTLKKHGIPVVNTVHDFKVICPNYTMLNFKGLCEECKGGNYNRCLKNKCVKGSSLASLVSVVEAYLHSMLKSYRLVDRFICPSLFYKNKLVEFGIPEKKVVHIPNFIDADDISECVHDDGYFLYLGRLSNEKGLKTLIKAMKYVKSGKLVICGTGPAEGELKRLSEDEGIFNIEFLGYKSGYELEALIERCMFTVLPSEWFENAPMSVLESMAHGKAVVGSNIGGIPELIDSSSGMIFEPGNIEDLSEKLNFMIDNQGLTHEMGRCGRKNAEENFSGSVHYEKLIKIYHEVLSE